MSQASEFASRVATRPDAGWQRSQIRKAIAEYRDGYWSDPAEAGWLLYQRLVTITDLVEGNEQRGHGDR